MGTTKKQKKYKLKNWSVLLWPILSIIVIWAIFSYPYFLKGSVPFPSRYLVSFFTPWNNYYGMPIKNAAMPDVITQIYPWKKLTIDSLKHGALPLWNPYQFSGNPHLANIQSAVFTPFNFLFFILPFIDAWSLLILLQPLCAALCMYLFLRSLSLSQAGSLVGSISFMFCSFIVTWMAYGTLGYALLFLPLFLYAVERFIHKKDWPATVLLILMPPLTISSGHFQTSLYVLIVGTGYLLTRTWIGKKWQILASALIYIGIGVLIVSVQIVPTYRFYSQSVRSESYIQDEAIPWNQFVRLIAPDFYGNPVTRNDWVGHYAEWGTYAGVIPFILALFALLKNNKNMVIFFFGGMMLIAVLFSFQPQLISLLAFSKIPVLSTSTPSRIVGIISFCIAVLAAFGLDILIAEWKNKKISKKLVITIVVSLFIIGSSWFSITTLGEEGMSIAKRNFILPTGFVVLTVFIFLIGFIQSKRLQAFLVMILVVLTSFEMLRFSTKWMPFDPREYVYPETPAITYLQGNAKENRVYGLIGNEVFGIYNLYGIEGYDPLYSKRYGEFIGAVGEGKIQPSARSAVVFPRTGRYAKRALDLLGVKYLIHSKGDGRGSWVFPFWEHPNSFNLVFADEKYEVYENIQAFTRVFLVNSYKIIRDDQQIIDDIFLHSIDLRKSVILEEEPVNKDLLNNCNVINSVESATIEKYLPTEIHVKTSSVCNSLIVLSDVYYPGWVAYVDGKKQPIYRANYTFRAVPVSEGEHTVVLKYENWYL